MPNGDLFIMKEYIRRIVDNNPDHRFSIACRTLYALFSDMNIEVLKRPHNINFNIKSDNINISKKYYRKGDTLYINVGGAIITAEGRHDYAGLGDSNKWFSEMIQEVNSKENIEPKLIFRPLDKKEHLPSIFNNRNFNSLHQEVKEALKKPCIFFYNIEATWTHANVQIKIAVDDNKLIEQLAIRYPSYMIIAAKETTVKLPNVLALSDVNIIMSEDGENLILYAYIAAFCSIIIAKQTGGSEIGVSNKFIAESDTNQFIIFIYSPSPSNTEEKKEFTMKDRLYTYVSSDKKHIIPTRKYDTESIMAEVEKIGPIGPVTLPTGTTVGGRGTRKYKRKRIQHRSLQRKRKATKNKSRF